jgi:hypothetical protein
MRVSPYLYGDESNGDTTCCRREMRPVVQMFGRKRIQVRVSVRKWDVRSAYSLIPRLVARRIRRPRYVSEVKRPVTSTGQHATLPWTTKNRAHCRFPFLHSPSISSLLSWKPETMHSPTTSDHLDAANKEVQVPHISFTTSSSTVNGPISCFHPGTITITS